MDTKRSFPPVVDPAVKVLVLGSLPGEASLRASQYYAHPQNQFWRLMSAVLGEDLARMAYADRLRTLLAHRVGLWDVVAEAHRQGSLDSQIKAHVGNDLLMLVKRLPKLLAIGFNGQTSARIGLRELGVQAERYAILQLPSSSPAYTMAFDAKCEQWEKLRTYL
ncbi:MAG: DNA-deoxyinosine glycosylase [Betaproteobacteria bacterium]|nr:DNA-deoxyinosine glycosylase [Betaproteobacteria bacterium]